MPNVSLGSKYCPEKDILQLVAGSNITVWWSYSNLRYPMKLTKFSVTILKPFIFFCQFMIVRVKVTSYLDRYLFKSLVCFSTISWSCMPSLSSFILQRLNFTCGSLITRNWGKRKRKNWTYLRISSQRFWYSSNVIPCNRTNGFSSSNFHQASLNTSDPWLFRRD